MSEIVVVVLFGVVTDDTGAEDAKEEREGKTDRNGENGAEGATYIQRKHVKLFFQIVAYIKVYYTLILLI